VPVVLKCERGFGIDGFNFRQICVHGSKPRTLYSSFHLFHLPVLQIMAAGSKRKSATSTTSGAKKRKADPVPKTPSKGRGRWELEKTQSWQALTLVLQLAL
jgi:hypothetical protein